MDLCKKTVKSNMPGVEVGVKCVAPELNAFNGDLSLKMTG